MAQPGKALSSSEMTWGLPGLVIIEGCGHSMNVVNCLLALEPLRSHVWEDVCEKSKSLCWLCCQDYKISIEDHTFVCIVQLRLLGSQRVSCFEADPGPEAPIDLSSCITRNAAKRRNLNKTMFRPTHGIRAAFSPLIHQFTDGQLISNYFDNW